MWHGTSNDGLNLQESGGSALGSGEVHASAQSGAGSSSAHVSAQSEAGSSGAQASGEEHASAQGGGKKKKGKRAQRKSLGARQREKQWRESEKDDEEEGTIE